MTLREQFKKEHPETVGEKDKLFDSSNYIDWLEEKLTWKKFDGNVESFPILLGFSETGVVLFVEDEDDAEEIIGVDGYDGICYQEIMPVFDSGI